MPNSPFTPEQISQILEEFFKAVGTRQYIGARYVPIFGRKGETSIQWDNTAPYEPLTIVLYQGDSYTSRQYVPAGVDITNELFWALTGNYNAQIEAYRREVQGFDQRITDVEDTVADFTTEVSEELAGMGTRITDMGIRIDGIETDLTAQIGAVNDEVIALDTRLTGRIDDIEQDAKQWQLPNEIDGMEIVTRVTYDETYGAQGLEVYEVDGQLYAALGFTTTDQNVDRYFLRIIDLATNAVIQTTTERSGHCNQISHHDGKLYVITAGIPAHNHTDVDVFTIQSNGHVAFDRNIDLAAIGFTYLSSFGAYKDSQWFATTGDQFYLIDSGLTERTFIGTAPRFAESGTYQSLKYDADLDLFRYTIAFPSKVLFFGIDMKPVHNMELKPAYNFAMMYELEDSSVHDGIYYFFNNQPRVVLTATIKVSTLWKFNPSVDCYDMYDIALPTGGALFINVDEQNADGRNTMNASPFSRQNAVTLKYADDLESLAFLPYPVDVQYYSATTRVSIFTNTQAVLRLQSYANAGIEARHANLFSFFNELNILAANLALTVNNKKTFMYMRDGSVLMTNTYPASSDNVYIAALERSIMHVTSGAATQMSGKLRMLNGSIDTTFGTGDFTA